MHHATLICKLELGLWSLRFTDPVIKLIFPQQTAGAAEVVNGFSPYLHILMSLYQFYIYHSKKIQGRMHTGTTTRQATSLCSHSHSHSRPSPEQPRDTVGPRSRSHLAALSQKPSLIYLVLHAQRHTGMTWSSCCSDSNRWCHTPAKMLQSLWNNIVKPLNLLARVADCNSVYSK